MTTWRWPESWLLMRAQQDLSADMAQHVPTPPMDPTLKGSA